MGGRVASRALGLGAALALGFAGLVGCEEANEGANGSACLKNRDCASEHCVATICQPKPTFGEGSSSESDAGADATTD